uniref:Nucleotide-diphospho-sugar transferase n=1 Tax=Chromera velia CCMP2878 TaxID=1169474 RepID=A0A0G4GTR1_9ALVE|eukprot:Cvel_23358.t1-p1 / transcript=Cvel_23358.t1 / gene=Cvel_23358 / organism=Chromera_velia_CCMP2878 / gene_product=Glycogenin-1, putative / transcript_product=Glycogenin-1, putative / location=Cvel_scaffold2398:5450-7348(+) / protein_length=633 / sequence_SO=supercontig / SO=protein_coding / is_pseudo=false
MIVCFVLFLYFLKAYRSIFSVTEETKAPIPPVEIYAVTSFYDYGLSAEDLRSHKQRLSEFLVTLHPSVKVVVYTTEKYVELVRSVRDVSKLRVGEVWEWGAMSEHKVAFEGMSKSQIDGPGGGISKPAEAHAVRALMHERLPFECGDSFNGWDERYCFWMDLEIFAEPTLGSDVLGPQTVEQVLRPLLSGGNSGRLLMALETDVVPSIGIEWNLDKGPIQRSMVSGGFLGGRASSALGWWSPKWWALFERFVAAGHAAQSVDHFVNAFVMDTMDHIFLLDGPSFTTPESVAHAWDITQCVRQPLSLVYQYLRDPEMRPDGCDLTHAAVRMIEFLGCRESMLPGSRGDVAFASLLTTADPGYTEGHIVLGNSIRLSLGNSPPFPSSPPMVLLSLIDPQQLSRVEELRQVGWSICHIARYPPMAEERVRRELKDQFSKLPLWTLTKYKRVVYMDADTLLLRPPLDLMRAEGKMAAVREWGPKHHEGGMSSISESQTVASGFQDYFNTGVFSISPSETEFLKLKYLRWSFRDYDLSMGEQGMLNAIYRDKESGWEELDFRSNGDTAMFVYDYEEWKRRWPGLHVIHFKLEKPFVSNLATRMVAAGQGQNANLLRLWDSFRYGERPTSLDSSVSQSS